MSPSLKLNVDAVPEFAVSVCMPVNNGEAFLPEAFACLAQQTFKDFEVIVLNDGSTDHTESLAQSLLKRYRLAGRVITTPDKHGAEQARHLACQAAGADLIAPCDCDDQWHPRYLEEMVEVLNSFPEVDFVYCDFLEKIQALGRVLLKSAATSWIKLTSHKGFVYRFEPGTFFSMLLQGQVLFPPCTVFRRAIYERVGGYAKALRDLPVSLDWLFGLEVARVGTVAFLHKPLLLKIVHGANVSGDPLRTATCDVAVLEWILTHGDLHPHDRRHARRRAGVRAWEVGYRLWSDQRDPVEARQWCWKSWYFYPSWRAVKLTMISFIPLPLIDRYRAARAAI